jgi:hypothetical protein
VTDRLYPYWQSHGPLQISVFTWSGAIEVVVILVVIGRQPRPSTVTLRLVT